MDFQIRVPVQTFQNINLTGKDLISLLEQEEDKLSKGFDTIIERKGEYFYYDRPGSHRREVYGDKLEGQELEDYLAIYNAIKYLKKKYNK